MLIYLRYGEEVDNILDPPRKIFPELYHNTGEFIRLLEYKMFGEDMLGEDMYGSKYEDTFDLIAVQYDEEPTK